MACGHWNGYEIKNAITIDGNETRVQLEHATEGLHQRFDDAEEQAANRQKVLEDSMSKNLAKGDKDARKGDESASGILPRILFLYIFRFGPADGRIGSFLVVWKRQNRISCVQTKRCPGGSNQGARRGVLGGSFSQKHVIFIWF